MKCPNCQAEVAAGLLSCPNCHGPLAAVAASSDSRPSKSEQPPFPPEPASRHSEVHDALKAPMLSGDEMPPLPSGPESRRWKGGEKVLGRYRILGELGQGGMGVVYRCFDEIGGIEVALKALPPVLSHNTVEMEEVRDNFQLVSRLVHQHVATVRTLERDPQSGDYYLILECVDGMDLRRWRKQKGGKAALAEVLPILRQVAQALTYAHSQRIIHRDIKPSNVMIRRDGTVKVLDFGLAAQVQTSLSRVSQVNYRTSGTRPYMPPEQWRGQYQDAATDQYSLAVMAYELLAGRLPFDSSDPAVLQQAVLNTPPEPVSVLPAPAWEVLQRGLAKERQQRYASCAEFIEALAGTCVAASRQSAATVKSRISRALPSLRYGLLCVVALILVGLAGWYFGIKRPQQQAVAEAERLAKETARLAAEERQAIIKAEADAFAALRDNQTAATLKTFLAKYPDGAHAAEAKADYDRLVTERQRQEAERQARIKAEADAYAALSPAKTEETLKAFLEKYPDGAHLAEAKAAYDRLVTDRQQQEAAEAKRKADEAEKERQQQAKTKEEFAAYVLLQANKTEAGLQAFLERFPDGAHARAAADDLASLREERKRQEAEVKAKEQEAAAWQKARSDNTAEAFKSFLEQYPNSAHASDADRQAQHLAAKQKLESNISGTWKGVANKQQIVLQLVQVGTEVTGTITVLFTTKVKGTYTRQRLSVSTGSISSSIFAPFSLDLSLNDNLQLEGVFKDNGLLSGSYPCTLEKEGGAEALPAGQPAIKK